ncbi:hypothetical protein PSY47_23765, partial [Shigella flexneri]|nr:hypothetical protein [Shigella flexneri]
GTILMIADNGSHHLVHRPASLCHGLILHYTSHFDHCQLPLDLSSATGYCFEMMVVGVGGTLAAYHLDDHLGLDLHLQPPS